MGLGGEGYLASPAVVAASALLGYLLVNTLKEPGNMTPETRAFADSAHMPGFDQVLGWVASGKLNVRIGAKFPLANAVKAHDALEGRQTTGKVLIIP